jgi:hypothetical protein
VCASHVIFVALFMVMPEMVLHNLHTTRLIGFRSSWRITLQGGSVRALSPVRVPSLFSAFVVMPATPSHASRVAAPSPKAYGLSSTR